MMKNSISAKAGKTFSGVFKVIVATAAIAFAGAAWGHTQKVGQQTWTYDLVVAGSDIVAKVQGVTPVTAEQLTIPSTLGSYPVRRMLSWSAVGLTALRNLLMPALVFLICRLIGLPEMYTQLAVIYSALPVASLTSTYVMQYDPDPEHHLIGAGFVFISTLLCAATLTLFLNLL